LLLLGLRVGFVELRRQIALLRSWFPLILASVLIGAGAAFVVSNLQERSYEAKATLIVGQSLSAANPDYTQLLVSQHLSSTYATVATTRPVLAAVVEQLGLGITTDDLWKAVRAEAPPDSTLITITARDPDPVQAAAIANALAAQLIAVSPVVQGREADIQGSIDADLAATQADIKKTQAQVETLTNIAERTPEQDAQLASLEARLITLRQTFATLLGFSTASSSNLLGVIEPAVPPDELVSPKPLLDTLVGALLGLLIAVGIVALIEFVDDRIRDADAVRETTGLSTLGTITRMRAARGRKEIYQLATLLYPRSGTAEAFRTLRANIEFAAVDATVRTLLVTSALPREGKTVTSANLAVAFAQAGRRVLLVDADLRRPGVHHIFDLPNATGLTNLLLSDTSRLDEFFSTTEQPNLQILTTGPLPPNPAELLGSQRMRTVLELLVSLHDLVILDSPPVQSVTDPAVLSSFVDGTLLVVDAARGQRRAVRAAREALARAGANVLGAVLNRIAEQTPHYADYYADSSDVGGGDKEGGAGAEVPANWSTQ
jgi:polysaccharide biosynthesis transport protein